MYVVVLSELLNAFGSTYSILAKATYVMDGDHEHGKRQLVKDVKKTLDLGHGQTRNLVLLEVISQQSSNFSFFLL